MPARAIFPDLTLGQSFQQVFQSYLYFVLLDHVGCQLVRCVCELALVCAASSGLFRQGSLVLPSSMDLTAYIGAVAQVQQPGPPTNPIDFDRWASA